MVQCRHRRPFVAGAASTGHITYKGFEHVRWQARIVAIEPMTRFAYDWHPYAIDPAVDYSGEPMTRVEFTLASLAAGTRLTVVESGFDALPSQRRAEALPMNERGWAEQLDNVRAHVGG